MKPATSYLTFGIIYLSNFCHLDDYKVVVLNVVPIFIYLITGKSEHWFIYLMPTRTSPSVNYLEISSAHFSIGFPCPFVLVQRICFYILESIPLIVLGIGNIFPQSVIY